MILKLHHPISFEALQRQAEAEAWSRQAFIDANNDPANLRPETPADNRSHVWEDSE
jgi:hypothetical protein